jgi:hypothetical protein
MKENKLTTHQIFLRISIVLLTTLWSIIFISSCNNSKNEIDSTTLNKVNVLWEDESIHSTDFADSIISVNPDKFVLNMDGPGSLDKYNTGPTLKELKIFIEYLRTNGWNGNLVMHPDCAKGEYQHDWNGKGGLPTIDTTNVNSWKVYVTYFNQIQDSLPTGHKFSELMIETENTYFTTNGSVKLQTKDSLFPKVKKFIKDPNVKLSTTSDWVPNWTNWGGIDYYYVQMYDMAYVYPCLGGHNKYSNGRVDTLINGMKSSMKVQKNMVGNDVFFIFTYSDLEKKQYQDAPMFGEKQYVWKKKEFMEFNKKFKTTFPTQSNTGIWSVEDAFKNW